MPLEDTFDFGQPHYILREAKPDLFARAVEAVTDGNGTLTHEGRLWTVGVIEAEKVLELFPERRK